MSLASSLSKEVTRGVETVFETVESSIGAPNPETLAKELVEMEKLALEEQNVEEQTESVQTVGDYFYILFSVEKKCSVTILSMTLISPIL